VNEEAIARAGLKSQREKKLIIIITYKLFSLRFILILYSLRIGPPYTLDLRKVIG
jgi:hypothetical protein